MKLKKKIHIDKIKKKIKCNKDKNKFFFYKKGKESLHSNEGQLHLKKKKMEKDSALLLYMGAGLDKLN